MAGDLSAATSKGLDTGTSARNVPSLIANAGGGAQKIFVEFFAAYSDPKTTRLYDRRSDDVIVDAAYQFPYLDGGLHASVFCCGGGRAGYAQKVITRTLTATPCTMTSKRA